MATVTGEAREDGTALSQEYSTPLGLAHSTMQALKERIKLHYDLASDYYLSLWYVLTMTSGCPLHQRCHLYGLISLSDG